MYYYITIL